MRKIYLFLALLLLAGPAQAQTGGNEDFSRGELFSIPRFLDTGAVNFSLPQRFSFPDNARDTSTFGVDVSHHVQDDCQCDIDWRSISEKKVQFVYVKATQGDSFLDKTAGIDVKAINALGTIDVGVFHFLSSVDDPNKQVDWFVQHYNTFGKLQLPPSLDLEWDLGPVTLDCPNDAIVKVKRANGTVLSRCDRWYKLTAAQIIAAANTLLDTMTKQSRQQPLLYTNDAWFKARIGLGPRVKELHTQLIWIADYSRDGLATEKPRVPNNENAALWQFSEAAKIKSAEQQLLIDASIYQGNIETMRRLLNVH